MLKLRERLAWLIFEHQVFGNFFFSFFFYNRSIYSTGNFKSVEAKFLKFRGWKYFKGHLIVLIFQFDRSSHQFAIRGAIVWKIRMENHRKSYSSLFTFSFHYFITLLVYSVHKEDFFFILSFQEERRNFRGMVRKPSDVERYYSHSSVRRKKPPPFISSIIATGTVL